MYAAAGGQSVASQPQLYAEKSRTDAVSSPVFKTSDIIDIDDHLDLVETEDGYLPMNCLSASDLSSNR
jgi:hypothetical protein